MASQILLTVLSTIGLALAAYACVAHAVFAARTQNALHELRGQVMLAKAQTPSAAVAALRERQAGLETRVTELANECTADRSVLAKVADRLHRLAGRVQGLQRADSLNAEPEPQDREALRAALLKGHHAVGTNHE